MSVPAGALQLYFEPLKHLSFVFHADPDPASNTDLDPDVDRDPQPGLFLSVIINHRWSQVMYKHKLNGLLPLSHYECVQA